MQSTQVHLLKLPIFMCLCWRSDCKKNGPDLLARVHCQKLTKVKDLVKKAEMFGPTRRDMYTMYTIEWPKGTASDTHPHLSDRLHNLCRIAWPLGRPNPLRHQDTDSSWSMWPKEGYPHQLLRDTHTGEDGHNLYRRRRADDVGFTTMLQIRDSPQVECPIVHCWVSQAHSMFTSMLSFVTQQIHLQDVNKASDAAIFGPQSRQMMVTQLVGS